jgi:hypothetical protein
MFFDANFTRFSDLDENYSDGYDDE